MMRITSFFSLHFYTNKQCRCIQLSVVSQFGDSVVATFAQIQMKLLHTNAKRKQKKVIKFHNLFKECVRRWWSLPERVHSEDGYDAQEKYIAPHTTDSRWLIPTKRQRKKKKRQRKLSNFGHVRFSRRAFFSIFLSFISINISSDVIKKLWSGRCSDGGQLQLLSFTSLTVHAAAKQVSDLFSFFYLFLFWDGRHWLVFAACRTSFVRRRRVLKSTFLCRMKKTWPMYKNTQTRVFARGRELIGLPSN